MQSGIRPAEFWKQTPRETWDIVKAFLEEEKRKDRAEWERTRWLATWIINMSQKYVKRDVRPEEILRFSEEMPPPVLPEEREKTMRENLRFHKSKFWSLLDADKDGNVRIFGEEDYERLMAKQKKKETN